MQTNEVAEQAERQLDPFALMRAIDEADLEPDTFADLIGVAPRTLGAWLVRDSAPRPAMLKAMASSLGVSHDDLLQK